MTIKLITPVSHLLDYAKIIKEMCKEDTNEPAEEFVQRLIRQRDERYFNHCFISYRVTCSRDCYNVLASYGIADHQDTVTLSLHMWRHVLSWQWLKTNDKELRAILNDIAYELHSYLPHFFKDITDRIQLDVKENIIKE